MDIAVTLATVNTRRRLLRQLTTLGYSAILCCRYDKELGAQNLILCYVNCVKDESRVIVMISEVRMVSCHQADRYIILFSAFPRASKDKWRGVLFLSPGSMGLLAGDE